MLDGTETKPDTREETSDGLPARGSAGAPLLLDVAEVGRLLTCSQAHVRRMADAGRMPRPVKLGTLVRWKRAEIDQWLADGCPDRRRSVLRSG